MSYNKFWKLLIGRKRNTENLRKAANIVPNTMTKFRCDKDIHVYVLVKFCTMDDIIEIIPEDGGPASESN